MGQPKQLLAYRGISLLRRAAETALETPFRPVIVVLGAEREKCELELKELAVTVAINPRWAEGIGASIREGVRVLEASLPRVDGALMMLQDQPLVTAPMLAALAGRWRPPAVRIAAAAYGETFGVPAIFDRSLFAELKGLSNSEGAKKVILNHPGEAAWLAMPAAGIDLDTREDYEKICEA
jgi:molybdenum cofactor cytidylyltransferase